MYYNHRHSPYSSITNDHVTSDIPLKPVNSTPLKNENNNSDTYFDEISTSEEHFLPLSSCLHVLQQSKSSPSCNSQTHPQSHLFKPYHCNSQSHVNSELPHRGISLSRSLSRRYSLKQVRETNAEGMKSEFNNHHADRISQTSSTEFNMNECSDIEKNTSSEDLANIKEEDFSEDDSDQDRVSSDDGEDVQKSKRMYLCKICWLDFTNKIRWKHHMKNHARKERGAMYYCAPHDYHMYEAKQFSEHFKGCKFWYLQKTIFKCSLCPKKFALKQFLEQHVAVHCNKNTFVCSLCNKSFTKERILRQHTLSHKELQQTCKVCSRPFRKYNDLVKHMLTHDNKDAYFCKKCNLGFKEKNQFKKHNKLMHSKKRKICNPE